MEWASAGRRRHSVPIPRQYRLALGSAASQDWGPGVGCEPSGSSCAAAPTGGELRRAYYEFERWPFPTKVVRYGSDTSSLLYMFSCPTEPPGAASAVRSQPQGRSSVMSMSVKGSECQASKLVNNDACPRPTTVSFGRIPDNLWRAHSYFADSIHTFFI